MKAKEISARFLSLLLVFPSLLSGCLTVAGSGMARESDDPLTAPKHGLFLQGRTAIDEQDFYALAGDKQAVRVIEDHRAALVAAQVSGQAVGYAGIAGTLLGAGALGAGVAWRDENKLVGLPLIIPGAVLMMVSFVAIPLGFGDAADAADAMSRPILPHGRALDAADQYNRSHGRD